MRICQTPYPPFTGSPTTKIDLPSAENSASEALFATNSGFKLSRETDQTSTERLRSYLVKMIILPSADQAGAPCPPVGLSAVVICFTDRSSGLTTQMVDFKAAPELILDAPPPIPAD